MYLEDYMWRSVRVVCTDGREYAGFVDMYCSSAETDDGEPAIALHTESGESVLLRRCDIESIEATD